MIMHIDVEDTIKTGKTHSAIQAAFYMVDAHARHDTMLSAIHDVYEKFPELDFEQLTLMWITVNATRNHHEQTD